MSRLLAAGRLRAHALADAGQLETSRVLLAELSGLLVTAYRRGPSGEAQRVGPAELGAWWAREGGALVELHRALARGALIQAGVLASAGEAP